MKVKKETNIDKNKKIIQFSTGRSGSTLVWQVLKEIFPNTIKAHEEQLEGLLDVKYDNTPIDWGNCRHPMVATQRDPRDVLVSRVRTRWYDGDPEKMRRELTTEILKREIGPLKTKEEVLRILTTEYQGPLLILNYERFYNDYEYIFDELEKFLDITIPNQLREHLAHQTSREKNLEIQNTFKSFTQVDKSTNIHGNHIVFPEPGSYKHYLDEQRQQWLTASLRGELYFWERYYETR